LYDPPLTLDTPEFRAGFVDSLEVRDKYLAKRVNEGKLDSYHGFLVLTEFFIKA